LARTCIHPQRWGDDWQMSTTYCDFAIENLSS
jgi:hypothetical protein